MKDTYCPLRKSKQLFNAGKMDEYTEPYCEEDEHPCDQDENGNCRMTDEIEAFLSDPSNLEINNEEG